MTGGAGSPRVVRVVTLAALSVLAMAWAWSRAWVCDDAFISFRYAENFAGGLGLVYNAGERVEGYSNPLWVWLCALAVRCGLDPVTFGQGLGIVCYGALVPATWWAGNRLAGRSERGEAGAHDGDTGARFLPLAAVGVALHQHLRDFSSCGLETLGFVLLVTLIVGVLARADGNRPFAVASLLCCLAAVTRPDGALVGALAGLLAVLASIRRRSLAPALAFGVPGFLLFVPFLGWRVLYYGELLPQHRVREVGARALPRAGRLLPAALLRGLLGAAAGSRRGRRVPVRPASTRAAAPRRDRARLSGVRRLGRRRTSCSRASVCPSRRCCTWHSRSWRGASCAASPAGSPCCSSDSRRCSSISGPTSTSWGRASTAWPTNARSTRPSARTGSARPVVVSASSAARPICASRSRAPRRCSSTSPRCATPSNRSRASPITGSRGQPVPERGIVGHERGLFSSPEITEYALRTQGVHLLLFDHPPWTGPFPWMKVELGGFTFTLVRWDREVMAPLIAAPDVQATDLDAMIDDLIAGLATRPKAEKPIVQATFSALEQVYFRWHDDPRRQAAIAAWLR